MLYSTNSQNKLNLATNEHDASEVIYEKMHSKKIEIYF